MRLVSFTSLANDAANSHELPKRIKIFTWGVNKTLKGEVIVNHKTAEVFNANQKALGRDVIALDYEHNTVPETPEFERTKEPRLVAAHLVPEIVVGDGVYLSVQDWTPSGQEYAKNYKDLSPAPYLDDEGVLIGLHSVALTQTGAVFDLTFLNSIGTPIERDLVTLSAAMGIETPDAYKLALKNRPANYQQNMNENLDYDADGKKKSIKVFRKAMAMGEDVSDEEVLKCMSEAIEKGKWVRSGPLNDAGGTNNRIMQYSMEEIAATLNGAIDAKLKPLTASLDAMTKAQADATKAAEQGQRDALVAQASREGKVIPLSADQIKTMPVDCLKSIVEKLPKTVPMERSPMARIQNGELGKIKGGPARQVSMTVQGVPITLNIDGAAPAQPQLSGLARASAAFQAQYESAQNCN